MIYIYIFSKTGSRSDSSKEENQKVKEDEGFRESIMRGKTKEI